MPILNKVTYIGEDITLLRADLIKEIWSVEGLGKTNTFLNSQSVDDISNNLLICSSCESHDGHSRIVDSKTIEILVLNKKKVQAIEENK